MIFQLKAEMWEGSRGLCDPAELPPPPTSPGGVREGSLCSAGAHPVLLSARRAQERASADPVASFLPF